MVLLAGLPSPWHGTPFSPYINGKSRRQKRGDGDRRHSTKRKKSKGRHQSQIKTSKKERHLNSGTRMCVKENVGEEGVTKEDGLMTVKERAWTLCEKSRVQLYEVKGHCSTS